MLILPDPIQFEWDSGNRSKNWKKYRVTEEECEEVFYDPHKRIVNDILHFNQEPRYILLGKTQTDQLLFLVFTVRKDCIRIISARDLTQREKKLL